MSVPQLLLLPVDQVELIDDNPRSISDNDFAQLCKDIQSDPTFLIQRPPLVNHNTGTGKMIVYAGNQRLKAARHNGMKEIHFWVEQDVPEDRQKERMLRDNLHRGEWDVEKLQQFNPDFLLNAGFRSEDLSNMFDDLLRVKEDKFDVDRAVKEIKTPQTKPGDLYALGSHRLLCGDSTKLHDVRRVCEGENPHMVYSDPPYNIGLDYKSGFGNKGEKREKYTNQQVEDKKSDKDYRSFIEETIQNALAICGKDVHFFYWCDENYIGMFQDLYKSIGIKPRRVCLWIKNTFNPVPQVAFNKLYEPCVYGTKGKPYLNRELNSFHEILNHQIGSVNIIDDILGMFQLWLASRNNTSEYEHPTEKPITLHEKPLKRCTSVGDIVLDLFGGSGSTLISCEQLKRRARIVELDPVFCDVIIKRWESLTGLKAVKL